MKLLKPNLALSIAVVASFVFCAQPIPRAFAADPEPAKPSVDEAANKINLEAPDVTPPAEPTNAAPAETEQAPRHHSRHSGNQKVSFGTDVEVKEGETVDELVVFGGSAVVHGKVRRDVVVFGGGVEVDGEIGGDTVVFGGGVQVRTNALIKGDAVVFGGAVDVAEGGTIKGEVVPFTLLGGKFGLPGWLRSWITECVFKLRPLAPSVGWVWVVAGAFFLLYLLVVAAFPKPVDACVQALIRRPVATILLGLLAKVLVPFVYLFLAVTGIGVFVIPFLSVAMFLAALVGKAALFQHLGTSLGRQFGSAPLQKPVPGFVLGWVLVTLLYTVPVVGMATHLIVGFWSLGCVVTALFGLRGDRAPRPAASPASYSPPGGGAGQGTPPDISWPVGPTASAAAPVSTAEPPPSAIGTGPTPASTARVSAAPAANVPEVLVFPRAGFWERVGAAFLDIALVSILAGLARTALRGFFFDHGLGSPLFMLVALAYFAGMWTWKGITVGGIVIGLKVVRLDNQPVTFAVSLVRSLAAAFSVLIMFLGFLWIAWDPDKQGWHDKIAGTVVLKLPRGIPLVCL